MTRDFPRTHWAAFVAMVGLGWWLVTVIMLHVLTADDYDPVEQTISELALGRYGALMTIAFFALGIGGLSLALGLLWSVRDAVFAPLLLAIAAVLWIVAGIFQTAPSGTEATIHDTAALASWLIVMGVMFLMARRFRRDEGWRSFALPTLLWGFVAVGSFFLFPLLGDDAFGLAQRLHIATWLSWLFATAFRLRSVTSARTATAQVTSTQ